MQPKYAAAGRIFLKSLPSPYKKPSVQHAYVRYRELLIENRHATTKLNVSRAFLWISGLFMAQEILSWFTGRHVMPNSHGGMALLVLIISWFCTSSARKDQRSVWHEQAKNRREMTEVGLTISDVDGRMDVYLGGAYRRPHFFSLRDESYS